MTSCSKQDKNPALNTNPKSTFRQKTGAYYAGVDAAGAYGWGSALSIFGPIGTACGIVNGGIGTSVWAYYWEEHVVAVIPTSDGSSGPMYDNDVDKAGYLHNQFILGLNSSDMINSSINSIEDVTDLIYNDLTEYTANEYQLNISDVRAAITKESLNNLLYSLNSCLENDRLMHDWIAEKSGSEAIADIYMDVRNNIESIGTLEGTLTYLDSKMVEVTNSTDFTEEEKFKLLRCLSIWKYSSILWRSNE